jgi:hypothetical protein
MIWLYETSMERLSFLIDSCIPASFSFSYEVDDNFLNNLATLSSETLGVGNLGFKE